MDSCADVLEVEQLIEGANYRVAERGVLLFQFLDAHQEHRISGICGEALHIVSVASIQLSTDDKPVLSYRC